MWQWNARTLCKGEPLEGRAFLWHQTSKEIPLSRTDGSQQPDLVLPPAGDDPLVDVAASYRVFVGVTKSGAAYTWTHDGFASVAHLGQVSLPAWMHVPPPTASLSSADNAYCVGTTGGACSSGRRRHWHTQGDSVSVPPTAALDSVPHRRRVMWPRLHAVARRGKCALVLCLVLCARATRAADAGLTTRGSPVAFAFASCLCTCYAQGGRVLSFGDGDKFQLGHGDGLPRTTPRVVAGLTDRVHIITAGCVLHVLLCRAAVRCMLHHDSASACVMRPPPSSPAAPDCPRATHAVAVGRTGGAWAWGSNKSGECGTGSVSDHVAVRVASCGYRPERRYRHHTHSLQR